VSWPPAIITFMIFTLWVGIIIGAAVVAFLVLRARDEKRLRDQVAEERYRMERGR